MMKKKEWEREEFCFLLTFVVVVGVSWKIVCAQRKCIYLSTTWTAFNEVTASCPLAPAPLCIPASHFVSFCVHSATVGALIDESAAGSMNTPRLSLAWACAISGNFHGMISFLQAASLSAFHVKHIYLDFNDVCNDGAKYFPHHIITSTQLNSTQLRSLSKIWLVL